MIRFNFKKKNMENQIMKVKKDKLIYDGTDKFRPDDTQKMPNN